MSLSLAPLLPLCSKLSVNELQIMFKCSQRHFQLFQTVIQPAKLLSTHAHTQMQTAPSGSLSRAFGTFAAVPSLSCNEFSLSGFLLRDGAKELERDGEINTGTDTDHHVMSDCRANKFLQECLSAWDSTGGNLNLGLRERLDAITPAMSRERRLRDTFRLQTTLISFKMELLLLLLIPNELFKGSVCKIWSEF